VGEWNLPGGSHVEGDAHVDSGLVRIIIGIHLANAAVQTRSHPPSPTLRKVQSHGRTDLHTLPLGKHRENREESWARTSLETNSSKTNRQAEDKTTDEQTTR